MAKRYRVEEKLLDGIDRRNNLGQVPGDRAEIKIASASASRIELRRKSKMKKDGKKRSLAGAGSLWSFQFQLPRGAVRSERFGATG